jgi:phosphotransferase system HPr (HPr) family protein
METVDLVVGNATGLHARPAALFAAAAAQFTAAITVENLDHHPSPVNAKSILMVLTAGVQHGHRIRLVATGPDETEAVAALRQLIEAGLGEHSEQI